MGKKRHTPEEIISKLRQVGPGCAGNPGRGCDPCHRGDRGHVLSLAPGVRRPEVGPDQAENRANPPLFRLVGAADTHWLFRRRDGMECRMMQLAPTCSRPINKELEV